MPQKRARITDENDPLTSTDRVLAGFEQVSKSTSQPVDLPDRQLPDLSERDDEPAGQPVETPTRQPGKKSTRQEADGSTSQQVNTSTGLEADGSTGQSPFELRKATFQLDRRVLEQLDRYHLQLQLDRGKSRTPYKEVIVEEAIARWLEQAGVNPDLFESLVERQRQREGG